MQSKAHPHRWCYTSRQALRCLWWVWAAGWLLEVAGIGPVTGPSGCVSGTCPRHRHLSPSVWVAAPGAESHKLHRDPECQPAPSHMVHEGEPALPGGKARGCKWRLPAPVVPPFPSRGDERSWYLSCDTAWKPGEESILGDLSLAVSPIPHH